MTKGIILENLILAVIKYDAWIFLPFLMDEKVKIKYLSKLTFFESFTEKLEQTKSISDGDLHLRKETSKIEFIKDLKTIEYNFFDKTHLNERLTIYVTEEPEIIFIDMLPF